MNLVMISGNVADAATGDEVGDDTRDEAGDEADDDPSGGNELDDGGNELVLS